MSSVAGIAAIGDYTVASNEDKIAALLALIPNPDTSSSSGAGAGGGFLDEMSPAAAVQLRVELAALSSGIELGQGEQYANGSVVVSAGQATANEIVIDTGIDTDAAFGAIVVDIRRAGVSVKADALVTDNEDGTLTISEVTTYAVTAGDVVTWFVEV